jgi:hypothetical protein
VLGVCKQGHPLTHRDRRGISYCRICRGTTSAKLRATDRRNNYADAYVGVQPKRKLSPEQVREIRERAAVWAEGKQLLYTTLGAEYGVGGTTIHNIVTWKAYRDVV